MCVSKVYLKRRDKDSLIVEDSSSVIENTIQV